MTEFRNNVAQCSGVNAAILAEYLWEQMNTDIEQGQAVYKYGHYWVRCSHLMMTAEFPFLSIHMAKDAIRLLGKRNIISKADFNVSRFDHTNWYTFTEYGEKLMREGEVA